MFPSARCRWPLSPGNWVVRGRVERFVEPSLLLLLHEGPRHGYELRDQIADLVGGDGADVGNVYRLLRQLELEGIVTSTWNPRTAGPARRTYSLTVAGRRLLDQWAEALGATDSMLRRFLVRYDASATSADSAQGGLRV